MAILSLIEFTKINESAENIMQIDEAILDQIVEAVGSESDVESAAKETHSELEKAFYENKIELNANDSPKHLILSSLILNLVEAGKLDPDKGDDIIKSIK